MAAQLADAPDRRSLRSLAAGDRQKSLCRRMSRRTQWLRDRNRDIDALGAFVPADEPIVAVGRTPREPAVLTSERLLLPGFNAAVSLPLAAVVGAESWYETHRWSVRLRHRRIDPRRGPSDARQWWRWHDRRAHRIRFERAATETILRFSHDGAHLAAALRDALVQRGIHCVPVAPPDHPPLNMWAKVGRVVFGDGLRYRRLQGSAFRRSRHNS